MNNIIWLIGILILVAIVFLGLTIMLISTQGIVGILILFVVCSTINNRYTGITNCEFFD